MALPAASTEHMRKRQYQPSIHSFFQRNASSTSSPSSQASRITSPLSPPLPAETQSSLLSVGMRVRKSVPEGYKTHKTMPAEGFPFPSTAPAVAAPVRPTYSTSNSRELAPFCGLHKVGGFSAQESFAAPPSSAPPAFPTADEAPSSSMPGLSMSQITLPSTQSSATSPAPKTTKKRSYDEEIEDDLDAYFDEVEAKEQRTPFAARRIAKLKNSPRKQIMAPAGGFVFTGGVEGDFEEAAFLVPMETDV